MPIVNIDDDPKYSSGARFFTELLDTPDDYVGKNSYKLVVGGENGDRIVLVPDESSSGGLSKWEPTLSEQPITLSSSFDGSVITQIPEGVNIQAAPEQSGRSVDAIGVVGVSITNTSPLGFYTSFQLPDNSSDVNFIFYDDPLLPSIGFSAFALQYVSEAGGIVTYNLLDSGIINFPVVLGQVTSTEILNNVCVSAFSTRADLVTFEFRAGGTSSTPDKIFSYDFDLAEIASNFNVDIPELWYFGFYCEVSNQDLGQVLVTQYATPTFEYDGVGIYTGGNEVDPASYPDNRESEVFLITGALTESNPADSVLGKVFAGLLWSFDENGVPVYSTLKDGPEGIDLVNPLIFPNDITMGNRFIDFNHLQTNNSGSGTIVTELYKKYLVKIRHSSSDSNPTIELPANVESQIEQGELLPYLFITAVGKDGVITLEDPDFGDFYVNGESIGFEYEFSSGAALMLVFGPNVDEAPAWHIVELAGASSSSQANEPVEFFVDYEQGFIVPENSNGGRTINQGETESFALTSCTPPDASSGQSLADYLIFSTTAQFYTTGTNGSQRWVDGEGATVRNAAGVSDLAFGLKSEVGVNSIGNKVLFTRSGEAGLSLSRNWSVTAQIGSFDVVSAPCRIKIIAQKKS